MAIGSIHRPDRSGSVSLTASEGNIFASSFSDLYMPSQSTRMAPPASTDSQEITSSNYCRRMVTQFPKLLQTRRDFSRRNSTVSPQQFVGQKAKNTVEISKQFFDYLYQ